MNVNDVYQVKGYFSLPRGQDQVFTHYYRCSVGDTEADAQDFYDVLILNILDDITDGMNETTSLDRVTVVNGMDNQDQHEAFPNVSGSIADEALPPGLRVAFRSMRNGLGTRYSYRHLHLGTVQHLDAGKWSSSAITGIFDTVRDALGEQLTAGSATLVPCQLTGGFVFGTAPTVSFDLKSGIGNTWLINEQCSWIEKSANYEWS